MRQVLDLVRIHTGIVEIEELDTELAARFVAARAKCVGANTVRGDLAYLSAAATIAAEEGWLARAPRFKRVRPRPTRPTVPKVHTIVQVGAVLELLRSRAGSWAGHRLYALAALAAYTGLRRDEVLWLKCEDVELAASLLRVMDRRRLKTQASAAAVPIPPELRAILETWLPRTGSEWLFPGIRQRGPWTGGANGSRPNERIREAGRECGVEGLTLQSLRHTFATHARRQWGLSELELADVLRHTSPATQRWYVHEARREELVASVSRVSYLK
jgi:integrase